MALCRVLTSIGLFRTQSIMPSAARFMLLSPKCHRAKTSYSSLDQITTTYFLMEYISRTTCHV